MLVHRATRTTGATGPPRDPARGGGRVRHRGGADRGTGVQGTHTWKRGGGAGRQGMYTRGEGPITEGPGHKVRTPGGGADRGAGGQGTYTRGRGGKARAQSTYTRGRGGGRVRYRGGDRGAGDKVRTPGEGRNGRRTRYIHWGGKKAQPEEEVLSDTGEGSIAKGLRQGVGGQGMYTRGRGRRYTSLWRGGSKERGRE